MYEFTIKRNFNEYKINMDLCVGKSIISMHYMCLIGGLNVW
jgi:hypothetical protein